MAKYKCDPNYEYIRSGLYVQFDLDGNYETEDKTVIAALDAAIAKSPFIKRVGQAKAKTEVKPEPKAEEPKPAQPKEEVKAEEAPKPKQAPPKKATAKKSKK